MPNSPDPLLLSVKDAAVLLGNLTPWSVYKLLDENAMESVYQGRRRYVVFASLTEYVKNLPTEAPAEAIPA
jgi:hypothetical protein